MSPEGDAYDVSTDPTRIDRALVHRFLSEESAWARGVPREVSNRAIDNSLCFGLYRGGEQVGFARVITDRATFAYVDDVFVVGPHRGKGLASRLVGAILSHPELRGVKSWWLLTGSGAARSLFERAGFRTPERERLERWMTLPGGGRGFYLRRD
ncbi:MAG: GNAT family N-acetyltransferase [Actinomycetota bacterium]|nr:GNAT family N-acetyltransferase [Actinomycetota bacterium]